jgi:hypothetical protein
MSRTKGFFVLAALLAAAGCASSPEVADETPDAAAVAAPEDGNIVPDVVVDANALVARTPPPVICRHMLKQGSNVIIERCMTAQDWKIYERREAQEAQAIVRTLQRGAYR